MSHQTVPMPMFFSLITVKSTFAFVKFCARVKFLFSDSLLVSQIIAGIVQQVYVKHTSSYVLQCVQVHVMFSSYTHRFNQVLN